jgi:hypothetical protein
LERIAIPVFPGLPPTVQPGIQSPEVNSNTNLLLTGPNFGAPPTIPQPPGGFLAPLTPGTSCDNAPRIALDTTYGPFAAPANPGEHWFRLPDNLSGTHRIKISVTTTSGSGSVQMRGWGGSDCGNKGTWVDNSLPTEYVDLCLWGNISSGTQFWATIGPFPAGFAGTYTLRVEPGAC